MRLFYLALTFGFASAETKETIFVAEGSSVTLNCPKNVFGYVSHCQKVSSSGDIVVYIRSSKIGTHLKESIRNRLSIISNCSIRIRNVSKEDEGLYQCTASTYEKSVNIYTVIVKLIRRPRQIMIEDDYNGSHIVRGIEGIDKTITCTIISGVPNNETLTLTTKSKILAKGGQGHVSFSFKPTKTDHQENITCTANHISTKAPITYSVILYLTLTPVVTIDVFPKRTVIEGQTLIISCRDENSVSTNTSVLFIWHHNYRKLDTTSPHLKFESIAKPDEGNYSCCASNKAGTGIEIVTITVMADVRTNRTFFFMASISGCSGIIVCIIASLLCYICKGRNDLESSRNLNYIDVQLGSFRGNQSRIRGIENRTEYADINVLAPAVNPLSSSSSNSDENSDDDFMYIGHDIEVENSL